MVWLGEIGLATLIVSITTTVLRAALDRDMLPRLVASIVAFVIFYVARGLAQWYVATLHVSPNTQAGQVALVFRVAMPVAIDLASMLCLSIMKIKSLKRYLAEMAQEAEATRAGQQEPSAGGASASLRHCSPAAARPVHAIVGGDASQW